MMAPKMQPTLGIVNAYNYWLEVIMPNWANFLQHSSAKNAFNLAASVWHVLEWIQKDERHGFSGTSKEAVRKQFLSQCPCLGVMHDIVTMSKHITVGTPRGGFYAVTGDPHQLIMHTSAGRMFPETASDFIIKMNDGTDLKLIDAFKTVIDFWEGYFNIPREPI